MIVNAVRTAPIRDIHKGNDLEKIYIYCCVQQSKAMILSIITLLHDNFSIKSFNIRKIELNINGNARFIDEISCGTKVCNFTKTINLSR